MCLFLSECQQCECLLMFIFLDITLQYMPYSWCKNEIYTECLLEGRKLYVNVALNKLYRACDIKWLLIIFSKVCSWISGTYPQNRTISLINLNVKMVRKCKFTYSIFILISLMHSMIFPRLRYRVTLWSQEASTTIKPLMNIYNQW